MIRARYATQRGSSFRKCRTTKSSGNMSTDIKKPGNWRQSPYLNPITCDHRATSLTAAIQDPNFQTAGLTLTAPLHFASIVLWRLARLFYSSDVDRIVHALNFHLVAAGCFVDRDFGFQFGLKNVHSTLAAVRSCPHDRKNDRASRVAMKWTSGSVKYRNCCMGDCARWRLRPLSRPGGRASAALVGNQADGRLQPAAHLNAKP
jgi:hypothetical protein